MPSPTKVLQIWAESALLHSLHLVTGLIPLRWVSLPGDLLGWAVFDLLRYKRRLALDNLALALGDSLSEAERRRVARRCFRFFGGLAFEIMAMPRISTKGLGDFLVLENVELLDAALARGKGVVLVSGHLGHWELMAGGLASTGRALSMYVGRQHNRFTDNLLNRIRRHMGTETFPKGAALRGILKALKSGHFVAMLSDQHDSRKRHYIRFFGEPVSTVPGPSSFARRSGAPLIFGYCIREGRYRYRARFAEIPYRTTDDEEADLLRISQAVADHLEAQARTYPEQYFWMHNRWRGISPSVVLSSTNRAFLYPPESSAAVDS